MLKIAQRDPAPGLVGAGSGGPGGGGQDAANSPQCNVRDAYVSELRRLSGADPTLLCYRELTVICQSSPWSCCPVFTERRN